MSEPEFTGYLSLSTMGADIGARSYDEDITRVTGPRPIAADPGAGRSTCRVVCPLQP